MTNSIYQQLDDERKRRVAAVQTLAVVENINTDLKKRLTAEEQAWKSADSTLDSAERQAESQRKLAREANDQLAAAKEQLATLRKQLEETQRLRDKGVNTVPEAVPVWLVVRYISNTGQYRCTVSGLPLFNIYIIGIYFKDK